MLAAATLPKGPKLQRLLALAPLVATIDRKQSVVALARLLLRRAMRPGFWYERCFLALSCLWSDAAPPAAP